MAPRPDAPDVLAGLLDESPYLVLLIDESGVITWVNDTVTRMFGYTVDEILGTNIFEYLDPEWDQAAFDTVGAALAADGLRLPTLFRVVQADGSTKMFEVWANAQLRHPVLQGLVVYVRRWDERMLLDEALESLGRDEPIESTLRLLVEAMACETLEASGSILFEPSADRFERGVVADDLDPALAGVADADPGTPWHQVLATRERCVMAVSDLPPSFRASAERAEFGVCWAWPVLEGRDGSVGACVVVWRRSDEVVPDHSRLMAMDRLGRIAGLALDRERALGQLRHAATHDSLTQLANRNQFYASLDAVYKGRREGDDAGEVAVLYLDLDRFKPVNDRLGHAAGDQVLTEVARRLSATVRRDDLVARLGGDEFAVLCRGVGCIDELEQLAERLLVALSQPYEIDGVAVVVGASVGIGVGTAATADGDALVEAADAALYQVKASGKGGWLVADPPT